MENRNPDPERPWQVWFCAILMALFGVASLFGALSARNSRLTLALLLAGVLNMALAYGLFALKRWCFIVTVVFTVLAVLATLVKGNASAVLINGAFLAVLLSSYKAYFPEPAESA